jgi:L-asparaginase II
MAEWKDAAELVRIIRDPLVECVHRGHVAIWHHDTGLIAGGATPARILPRSAMKMIQALPLVESGAADAAGCRRSGWRWPAPRTRARRSTPTW